MKNKAKKSIQYKRKLINAVNKQTILQVPVVQTLDSDFHRINHYPADSVIDFRNTYPLYSDLSGG